MIVGGGVAPFHLEDVLDRLNAWAPIAESDGARSYLEDYIKQIAAGDHGTNLRAYRTFLPPRLVSAAKEGRLVTFFGAGLSVAAGVPTWNALLDRLGLVPELKTEPHLAHDPLTLAELLAHEIGNLALQDQLRAAMRKASRPTIAHLLLVQLSQPVYVTTNYDALFEEAWHIVHGSGEGPVVLTNDSDFARNAVDPDNLQPLGNRPLLIKIHGCARRESEEMILTRSQYRRHYRSNEVLFKAIRDILRRRHTLFLGFGHRDPEITRLVEDVIHAYETASDPKKPAPALYSLQFDMRERTPEVFAARGILALQPPLALEAPEDYDYRSVGTAQALADLVAAMDSSVHEILNLDQLLRNSVDTLSDVLQTAMKVLKDAAPELLACWDDEKALGKVLGAIRVSLGALAGQGVYVLRENGDIHQTAFPPGLTAPERTAPTRLHQRGTTFAKHACTDSRLSPIPTHQSLTDRAPSFSASLWAPPTATPGSCSRRRRSELGICLWHSRQVHRSPIRTSASC